MCDVWFALEDLYRYFNSLVVANDAFSIAFAQAALLTKRRQHWHVNGCGQCQWETRELARAEESIPCGI